MLRNQHSTSTCETKLFVPLLTDDATVLDVARLRAGCGRDGQRRRFGSSKAHSHLYPHTAAKKIKKLRSLDSSDGQ